MAHEIYRTYSGEEILEIPEDSYIPLIERIIYKNDLIGISGQSKTNKSIFAMQLACSLSIGKSFLGTFQVPKPKIIWYFATEGKDNEIKDRFMRMSKSIPTNLDNIVLFCSTQLKINSGTGNTLIEKILFDNAHRKPGLIIVDSVYSGYLGKLSDDDVMNAYITKIRYMMEKCDDSSALLVHHFKKPQKTSEGKEIHQDENSSYGSVFFLGQLDHCFTIKKCNKDKMDRIIECNLQRSGKIIEDMRLRFHEPEPLYFTMVSQHKEEERKIMNVLHHYKEGLTSADVQKITKITRSLCYVVIGEMEEKRMIVNSKGSGGYNGKYTLLGGC